jgi:ABC-type uncharacterized transport system permease subunit
MNHLFFLLTLAAYVGSLAAYIGYLVAGLDWSGRLGSLLLVGGLVAHYFALLERARGLHTVPYHDLSGSMSLFGWLLALTYFSLNFFTANGLSVRSCFHLFWHFPLRATLSARSFCRPASNRRHFAFHVTLSILAYAAFGLSCVLSLIYLGEQRLLHEHRVGDVVWRLPSSTFSIA